VRIAVSVEQCWHVVPGGIATSTIELSRALSARPDVDLVGVAARHAHPPADAFRPPVPVRHLAFPRRVLYETWQRLRWPAIEVATGAVDVFHDLGYVFPPSRAPAVATVHDTWFLRHPDDYTRHAAAVLVRGFELARRHARLVMCPSQTTIDACRAAGIGAERLRLVPWGVRARPVGDEEAERIVRRHALDRPYVLYTGTVERRKNVIRLMEAFERLGRGDLDIVIAGARGWSPPGWEERFERAVARLGHRVRVLGAVLPGDLDALCAKAAVVVYPSLGEGFGFPVLYAMAQGTPVVTSSGTATEEIAADAALVVDPLDVDAIADGIGRAIEDRALANALVDAGRRRADAFTWDRSARLAAAVYAEASSAGR
jgi:glycosyltransferase involved in cell wall biosynthesis